MTDVSPEEIRTLDPTEVSPGEVDLDLVRAALESDDNLVRADAARICTALAQQDAGAVDPIVATLRERLDDERVTVTRQVAAALAPVAEQEPEKLAPAADDLVALFQHEVPLVRTLAARIARPMVIEEPAWFADEVEGLLAALAVETTDPTEEVDLSPQRDRRLLESLHQVALQERGRHTISRTLVGNVLVEVADVDPEAVLDHRSAVVDLLEADAIVLVDVGVRVLSTLAEEHPDEVAPAAPALRECLTVDNQPVVANAVAALGFLEDEASVDALRALADDAEVDEDLRDMAEETADWIETQSD